MRVVLHWLLLHGILVRLFGRMVIGLLMP
jgi:hypothetical protein